LKIKISDLKICISGENKYLWGSILFPDLDKFYARIRKSIDDKTNNEKYYLYLVEGVPHDHEDVSIKYINYIFDEPLVSDDLTDEYSTDEYNGDWVKYGRDSHGRDY